MVGACQTATAEANGRHAEIATVLLNHYVSRKLGGAEETVQAGIHPAGLVNAVIVLRVGEVVARVELHKGESIGSITIDLVCAHEDERGLRAETPHRLKQVARANGIHVEVVERAVLAQIVGGLGRAVDQELRADDAHQL